MTWKQGEGWGSQYEYGASQTSNLVDGLNSLKGRTGKMWGGTKTGANAGWKGVKTGGRGAVRGAKFTTGESMKAARFVGRHKYSVPLATGLAVGGGAFLVHHRNNSSGRHDDQGIR